ncbi:MAG TPA: hypothetical protein VJ769_06015, partial [Actinomycetes bacterium]|nr:hypothetical protein [Actinomycetes bacterium]
MEPSLVGELRPLFAGRKLVLTGGPLAAMTGACRRVREIAGRRVYGPRPEWRRLEDKVVIDALWDELGVASAPSEVVTADPAALRAAARRLDWGTGTAWAGDARQG